MARDPTEDHSKLLPEQLDELWQRVEAGELDEDEFDSRNTELLRQYRDTWTGALLLEGRSSLKQSLLAELDLYFGEGSSAETESRCRDAAGAVPKEWRRSVDGSRASIEAFYDESVTYLYDLMWWHTLEDDDDPLAYVLALHFAARHGCHRYLDFGAGVGSGSILFARHGMEVTHADLIDTKIASLPPRSFQLVTAMDTLEHLVDPVETIEQLWECLEPGGYLYGRFWTKPEDSRPQHIVRDFGPTLERMSALGFVQVWRDDWLWGHQVFRKT
jgi:hypothetical protein